MLNKLIEPVILKESSYLQDEYDYVKKLLGKNNDANLKLRFKQLEYGIIGENNIIYELKNSHMPMYILRDINLKYSDFSSQIDYIVITKSGIYVIESKNLFGNIKIDDKGNFVRSYEINDKLYEEGIYSPIEQNEKHLELLKFIGNKGKKNIFDRYIFNKYFYDNYKSLVVLSNSKTVLDDKKASKEIRNKIIKVDGLINYLKESNKMVNQKLSDKAMFDIANSILEKHQEQPRNLDIVYKDYLNSYYEYDSKLLKELKKFRYYISNKEGLPAYVIFNDKTLNLLVQNKPKNNDELMKIAGFNKWKNAKYGKRIIEIIGKYL